MGNTALYEAIYGQHQCIINYLIEHEAEVNSGNNLGITPLMAACARGYRNGAETLMKAGANLNLVSKSGSTALHEACKHGHVSLVNLLIKYGCEISKVNQEGKSPIHIVCERGFDEVLKILFEHEIDFTLKDKKGKTAIVLSTENGHEKTLSLMLEHKSEYINSQDINNAMYIACNNGYENIVSLLLKHGKHAHKFNIDKAQCILAATENGHEMTVKVLLEYSTGIVDTNYALRSACTKDYYKIVSLLLEYGANVNLVYNNETPLMLATKRGHEMSVKALLDHSPRIVDTNDALHSACHHDHFKVVSLLLQYGATVNHVYNDETPLMIATEKGHVNSVKALLEHKTEKVDTKYALHSACRKNHDQIVSLLLRYGADVNQVYHNETPLMIATELGHVNCVRALLKNSIGKVNTDFVLHTACMTGDDNIGSLLLQYGVNVNQMYMDKTPLMIAAEKGHINSVHMLLTNAADELDTKNIMHYASDNDLLRGEIISLLLKYGVDVSEIYVGAPLNEEAEAGHVYSVIALLDSTNCEYSDINAIFHYDIFLQKLSTINLNTFCENSKCFELGIAKFYNAMIDCLEDISYRSDRKQQLAGIVDMMTTIM